MTEDHDKPNAPPRPQDPILRRRGDNVGQSGRWYRADDGKTDAERHYGHEERWHSTDHPAGLPHETDGPAEPDVSSPGARSPDTPGYGGRIAPPEKGEQHGDDQARYRDKSYADPGGTAGADQPKHPGKRWEDQGGAGHGEEYGSGREPKDAASGEREF